METSTAQQHDRRKERSGRASGKREVKKMGHPYIYIEMIAVGLVGYYQNHLRVMPWLVGRAGSEGIDGYRMRL